MLGLGPAELFIILLGGLFIFGPKRLPEIAKSIGKVINNINSTTRNFTNEIRVAVAEEEEKEKATKSNS